MGAYGYRTFEHASQKFIPDYALAQNGIGFGPVVVVQNAPAWFGGNPVFRETHTTFYLMSVHSSLRGASSLSAKRNVLKRFERVEILKKRGQWKEGDRITGLRKTKPATA